jgi:hypothetical protein
MSGPEEPLEPLAPSPYASVIYSALRTRSKSVPSDLATWGITLTSPAVLASTGELALIDPGEVLGRPRLSLSVPLAAWDPRKLARPSSGVKRGKDVGAQRDSQVCAGSGGLGTNRKIRKVTKKEWRLD